jgi:hypothetical protein
MERKMNNKPNLLQRLLRIQAELNAPKDLFNKFGGYKYRSCESILKALKPLLEKEHCVLTLNHSIVQISDRFYVQATATLFADNQEELPHSTPITCTAFARETAEKKGMDAAQITGAAISYASKYALNAMFLIDDTKDPDTEEYSQSGKSKRKNEKSHSVTPPAEEQRGDPEASIEDLREEAADKMSIIFEDNGKAAAEFMSTITRWYQREPVTSLNAVMYRNTLEKIIDALDDPLKMPATTSDKLEFKKELEAALSGTKKTIEGWLYDNTINYRTQNPLRTVTGIRTKKELNVLKGKCRKEFGTKKKEE